jgi:HSP20 family protein
MAQQQQQQPQRQTGIEPQKNAPEQKTTISRGGDRPGVGIGTPLAFMRRVSEAMDRLFEDFAGPGFLPATAAPLASLWAETTSWPEVEVFQRGNELVIRADVPGMSKDDVKVELRDDVLYISGERTRESKKEHFYRTERSYGSFLRAFQLPPGAKPETASATFENGVLEVGIEVPSLEQKRARRIDVREGKLH